MNGNKPGWEWIYLCAIIWNSFETVYIRGITIRPAGHFVVSAAVSVPFYAVTGSLAGAVLCFVTGVFMDLDHLLEYFFLRGFTLNPGTFIQYWYTHRTKGNCYLVAHGYEYIAILWPAAIYSEKPLLWAGVMLGYGMHLICDVSFNSVKIAGYSLIYRAVKRFRREAVTLF